jgi:hypothetical protein
MVRLRRESSFFQHFKLAKKIPKVEQFFSATKMSQNKNVLHQTAPNTVCIDIAETNLVTYYRQIIALFDQ